MSRLWVFAHYRLILANIARRGRNLSEKPARCGRQNLRVLCWIWIVLSTIVILLHAPVSVARQSYAASGFQTTSIEWIGPFEEPSRLHLVTKSSIDFSRLIIAILAVNLVPALLLWQREKVTGWLKAQQPQRAMGAQSPNNEMVDRARPRREAASRRLLISCVICLLAICLFLVGVLIYNQQSMPTAAREIPAEEWKEVRRAIPVTR